MSGFQRENDGRPDPWGDNWSKTELMENVIRPVVFETVEDAGFGAGQFHFNRKSVENFLKKPLTESGPDGRTIGPYFEYIADDALYRVEISLCCHDPQNPGAFDVMTILFRLRDYMEGNREWEAYNPGEGVWEIGPGEDFFDIADFEPENGMLS